MSTSEKRLEELVNSLIGSWHDLDYYLEEGEVLSIEDLIYIDNKVAVCNVCGLNLNPLEINHDGICWKCE